MLNESEVRGQFADVVCLTCSKPASQHGLHAATWVKGTCVWTWIGVIKSALARVVMFEPPTEEQQEALKALVAHAWDAEPKQR